MKAIQIHSYGDVDVLMYEDVPAPQPGPQEVLIRVKSVGVNPLDWKIRSGALAKIMPRSFPAILGWDVSGTINSIGEGVTEFHPGDEIVAHLDTSRNGAYAELVVANATLPSFLPQGLDISAAAGLPTVALTGIQLVETVLGSKPGQKVLVTGALGGVGRAAIFALKEIGSHVVAGVRGSQREEAAALHADDVVALDDPEDLKRAGPFDAVADTIGGGVASSLLAYIRSGGVLATTVPPAPQTAPDSGVTNKAFNMKPNRLMLDRILKAASDGELIIPLAQTFPLAEARKAHALGEKGVNGKILLEV